jgi:hypothetical protein
MNAFSKLCTYILKRILPVAWHLEDCLAMVSDVCDLLTQERGIEGVLIVLNPVVFLADILQSTGTRTTYRVPAPTPPLFEPVHLHSSVFKRTTSTCVSLTCLNALNIHRCS